MLIKIYCIVFSAGILIIFGLAIITKNVMNFLSTFQITNSDCQKGIFAVFQVVQTVFIVAEVHFLFHCSKLCLQEKKFLDRSVVHKEHVRF